MLTIKYTKEGVLNEKLTLKKLLNYMRSPKKSSVYRIKEKEDPFRCLTSLCRCCSS